MINLDTGPHIEQKMDNEYGVAKNVSNGLYYIDDAVPFVVYKEQVPANRLVVKNANKCWRCRSWTIYYKF
jgi:hypothetical protein